MAMMSLILLAVAYLIGSIPSAILICKAMKLPDPRENGSGNPGATNVLRTAGKTPAILVLVADVLKGLIPVFIASVSGMTGFMLGLVVLAATLGHMFSVFCKFQGGKGVATAFGGTLALSFLAGLIALIVWALVLVATRYVSLASLIGAALASILILFVQPAYFLPLAVTTGLIAWRHMPNIERLKAGTENKMDFNKYR